MKRVFGIITLFMMCAMCAVGCDNPDTGDNQPAEKPVISVDTPKFVLNGEQEQVVFYYTIKNRTDNELPMATSTADWISGVAVNKLSVSFTVAENSSRLPRRATIEVAYGEGEPVVVDIVQNELTRRFDLFPMYEDADIPYRIPAVAVTNNGTIIAAADYRHSRVDIGVADLGRIDLHMRKSYDNGVTWGDIEVIIEGLGAASPDFMNVGYGDPCIVADRESSRVLLMSCAGNVSYQAGTRDNHQNIARFYSDNGGETWSKPVDISETIYSKFDDCSFGPVKAMFVASGRIMQSRKVKVGDYYRLYCAILVRNRSNTAMNFVLYSDNFGDSWEVLGGVAKVPITNNCDEPKVEELPDGSVLLSSRWTGGRYYNIFTFSDANAATGKWSTASFSGSGNGGVIARDNSTNGEVMLIPATRVEDGADVDLLLQSVPLGPERKNVGIYYKALVSSADYSSPATIAKDWEGVYRVTTLNSAYSTMAWQQDGRLAFLWEETTYCSGGGGYGGYTIAYDSLPLERITEGKYVYRE